MKIYLSIWRTICLALLTSVVTVEAQSATSIQTDADLQGIRNHPRTETVTYYESGVIANRDSVWNVWIRRYNESGGMISELNTSLGLEKTVTFDGARKISERTVYRNGRIDSIGEYIYEGMEWPSKLVMKDESGLITNFYKYKYDLNNFLIEAENRDSRSELKFKVIYAYSGRDISSIQYVIGRSTDRIDWASGRPVYVTFRYDGLIDESSKNSDFVFDQNDNWTSYKTEETMYKKDGSIKKTYSLTDRVINYY